MSHKINDTTTLEPDGNDWQLVQTNSGRCDIVDLNKRDLIVLQIAINKIIMERKD